MNRVCECVRLCSVVVWCAVVCCVVLWFTSSESLRAWGCCCVLCCVVFSVVVLRCFELYCVWCVALCWACLGLP